MGSKVVDLTDCGCECPPSEDRTSWITAVQVDDRLCDGCQFVVDFNIPDSLLSCYSHVLINSPYLCGLPQETSSLPFGYFNSKKYCISYGQSAEVEVILQNSDQKYSSVTRDYYRGFGASAATYTGNNFLFNSFDIDEYVNQVESNTPTYSLFMDVSENVEKLFWLYWRLYETEVPVEEYKNRFNSDIKKDYNKMLTSFKLLGYLKSHDQSKIILNKRGIHNIHLLQNHFALNYVNRIWSENLKESNPKEIILK